MAQEVARASQGARSLVEAQTFSGREVPPNGNPSPEDSEGRL